MILLPTIKTITISPVGDTIACFLLFLNAGLIETDSMNGECQYKGKHICYAMYAF